MTNCPTTPPHTAQQSCHGLRSVRSHLHTEHSSPAMVYDQSDHTSTQSTAVLPWFTISPITPPHTAQQSCHGLRSVRSHLHTQHSSPAMLYDQSDHTSTHSTALRSVFSFTCVEHILLFVSTGAILGFILALSAVALVLSGFGFLIYMRGRQNKKGILRVRFL